MADIVQNQGQDSGQPVKKPVQITDTKVVQKPVQVNVTPPPPAPVQTNTQVVQKPVSAPIPAPAPVPVPAPAPVAPVQQSKRPVDTSKLHKLVLSDNFKLLLQDILNTKKSKICQRLLELEGMDDKLYDISFIDRTDSDDTITFFPSNRVNRILERDGNLDACWTSSRQPTPIGRFIRRIFGNKFNNENIELFVNKYKTAVRKEKSLNNFELVEGEDIRYWYNSSHYENRNGSMGSSCMSGSHASRYFGIYEQNPNQVKLCILKNVDGDKIVGRALVWSLSDPEGEIYMDRIYTNDSSMERLFEAYATRNGWICRTSHGFTEHASAVGKDKKRFDNMRIRLENSRFQNYPYMDTFAYLNLNTKDLYNTPHASCVTLRSTVGGHSGQEYGSDYNPMVEDGYNGGEIDQADAVFCEYGGGYTTRDTAIECRFTHRFGYPSHVEYSEYSDAWFPRTDLIWSDMLKCWIWKKYAVEVWLDADKTKKTWSNRLENKKTIAKIQRDIPDISNLEVGDQIVFRFTGSEPEPLPNRPVRRPGNNPAALVPEPVSQPQPVQPTVPEEPEIITAKIESFSPKGRPVVKVDGAKINVNKKDIIKKVEDDYYDIDLVYWDDEEGVFKLQDDYFNSLEEVQEPDSPKDIDFNLDSVDDQGNPVPLTHGDDFDDVSPEDDDDD